MELEGSSKAERGLEEEEWGGQGLKTEWSATE